MTPLWLEFPHIPWGSIGWRMGGGEVYWHKWTDWFRSLAPRIQGEYRARWPEPPEWAGLYEWVLRGRTPPRVAETNRRVNAAAGKPGPDELVITDRYRCLWLLRHYLQFAKARGDDALYRDPDGVEWLLVVGASESGTDTRYLKRVSRVER